MPTKPKSTQKETPDERQGRDCFYTPRYATKVLMPFIPDHIKKVWEPAAGNGKISDVLSEKYEVISTDIVQNTQKNVQKANFLTDEPSFLLGKDYTIITNPPFSIKSKFYQRCKHFGVPFALLLPSDYCGWLIDAIRYDKIERIIPTKRMNLITPTGRQGKNSNPQMHLMWLTWGFNIGASETFVDIPKENFMDI